MRNLRFLLPILLIFILSSGTNVVSQNDNEVVGMYFSDNLDEGDSFEWQMTANNFTQNVEIDVIQEPDINFAEGITSGNDLGERFNQYFDISFNGFQTNLTYDDLLYSFIVFSEVEWDNGTRTQIPGNEFWIALVYDDYFFAEGDGIDKGMTITTVNNMAYYDGFLEEGDEGRVNLSGAIDMNNGVVHHLYIELISGGTISDYAEITFEGFTGYPDFNENNWFDLPITPVQVFIGITTLVLISRINKKSVN